MSSMRAHGDEERIHVIQGSFEVSDRPDVVMSTILGSCVAACIRDPSLGVGGMNHFLLPVAPDMRSDDRRYGVQAMELLINGLLQLGAVRHRLEAKLFGGARMTAGMSDIGAKNIEFAQRFLADEGIPVVAESLGGLLARRIHYRPALGTVQQHLVTDARVGTEEVAALRKPRVVAGDMEIWA